MKKTQDVSGLSPEHCGDAELPCSKWQGNNEGLQHNIATLMFILHQKRSDVVSCYSMLQTGQDTKQQSAAFHHYRAAYTGLFHDITLQLSQKHRYCTNIEKAQKCVATQTVSFHTVLKLHPLRSIDIVPYLQPKGWYYKVKLYSSPTKLWCCQRWMNSALIEHKFQRSEQHKWKLLTSSQCFGESCTNFKYRTCCLKEEIPELTHTAPQHKPQIP